MGRANFRPSLHRRTTGLCGAVFLLLATVASHANPWEAPPRRWAHERGSACMSGISSAASPEGLESWIWTYRAKSGIATTPLVWDDVCFVFDGDDAVALSVRNGKVIARTRTKRAKGTRPALHARALFVIEGTSLVQYRIEGDKLVSRWSIEVGKGASSPAIHDGEIYLTAGGKLHRLRAAVTKPLWSVGGGWTGNVAVYGKHVYALRNGGGVVKLSALDRKDGSESTGIDAGTGTPKGVALSSKNVAVDLGGGKWSLITRTSKKGEVTLTAGRELKLAGVPLVGSRAFLARAPSKKGDTWSILRATKRGARSNLVSNEERPDLFAGTAVPVGLDGGSIAFGPWCYDININRILWNVREALSVGGETPGRDAFARGTKFGTVPAGHRRVVLVSADGKFVSALGNKDSDS